MGLMDIENIDKEPNRGGRPSKEEKKEEAKRVHENGLIDSEADKDWWDGTLEEVLGTKELSEQGTEDFQLEVEKLVSATCVSPIDVRKMLDQHGFIDHDWVDFLAHRPHHCGDSRLPDKWTEATSGYQFSMGDTTMIHSEEEEPMYDFFEKLKNGLSPSSESSDMLSSLMGDDSSDDSEEDNEPSSGLQNLISGDDEEEKEEKSSGIDSLLEETEEEEEEEDSSSLEDLL